MSEIAASLRRRRRRADADRSSAAVLQAAKEILAAQPGASVEDIATAAGVSRQTVYAHFKTRDALVKAVIDAIADEATAEMDAAHLEEGPAAQALLRMLSANWRTFQRYSLLLTVVTTVDHTRHQTTFDHLERLLTRGQRAGEFTRDLPVPWLATAVITLGHAAGDEVGGGRMTPSEAANVLTRTVLHTCGVDPSAITELVD